MARIKGVADLIKMNKGEPEDHQADAHPSSSSVTNSTPYARSKPCGVMQASALSTKKTLSQPCGVMQAPTPTTKNSSTSKIRLVKSEGIARQPCGDMRAPTTKPTRRAPKKIGPCHFGCLTTAQSNWECSPVGSSWWGIPAGSALCHAHYLRGWRYARRHGHDPPDDEAPTLL